MCFHKLSNLCNWKSWGRWFIINIIWDLQHATWGDFGWLTIHNVFLDTFKYQSVFFMILQYQFWKVLKLLTYLLIYMEVDHKHTLIHASPWCINFILSLIYGCTRWIWLTSVSSLCDIFSYSECNSCYFHNQSTLYTEMIFIQLQ